MEIKRIDKRLLKAIRLTNEDPGLVDFLFKHLKKMPCKHKESYIQVKKEIISNAEPDSRAKSRGKYIDWMFKGSHIHKQKNTQHYSK
jgi:hypothetical protein